MTVGAVHSYGQELRAIGQDLEARHVKAQFHIECQNDEYRVWTKAPEARESRLRSALRRIHLPYPSQSRPKGDTQLEDLGPSYFSGANQLRYQPEDLERLESEGQAKRRDPNGMPDPYSLSQLLRALGNYVNLKPARFLALSWTEEFVGLVYETAEGRRNVEYLRLPSIYDLWVHMYLRRRNANISDIQLLRH
jgi:hypothetical protein